MTHGKKPGDDEPPWAQYLKDEEDHGPYVGANDNAPVVPTRGDNDNARGEFQFERRARQASTKKRPTRAGRHPRYGHKPYDDLPDVRDGLTRKERIVLYVLHQSQKEMRGRNVPTAMLYGRVTEYIDMSVGELQRILQRLMGKPITDKSP